jgi:hypothetical protein
MVFNCISAYTLKETPPPTKQKSNDYVKKKALYIVSFLKKEMVEIQQTFLP